MVRVPDDITDEEATLIVTSGTAMYGLDVMGGIIAGEAVVVTGPGPIGPGPGCNLFPGRLSGCLVMWVWVVIGHLTSHATKKAEDYNCEPLVHFVILSNSARQAGLFFAKC